MRISASRKGHFLNLIAVTHAYFQPITGAVYTSNKMMSSQTSKKGGLEFLFKSLSIMSLKRSH